jgi:DNA-binding transcriptional MerR regulator
VTDTPIEIPDRAAFRASEVCEIAQIPPYVLRSWEKEFPGLGAAARPGGPRIYRRSDVEQILRIKQFVFEEGLTLAGVRRRIEGEPPSEEEPLLPPPPVTADVRSRVGHAKRELRELLDLLSDRPAATKAERSGEVPARGADGPSPEGPEPTAVADLPLLEGLLDTPPKRRRRGAKQARGGEASEVE